MTKEQVKARTIEMLDTRQHRQQPGHLPHVSRMSFPRHAQRVMIAMALACTPS
jgi:ABC-type microcin C transport system duplicated ATPase subunit YejF